MAPFPLLLLLLLAMLVMLLLLVGVLVLVLVGDVGALLALIRSTRGDVPGDVTCACGGGVDGCCCCN